MTSCRRLTWMMLAGVIAPAVPAAAQSPSLWKPPPNPIAVDLRAAGTERQIELTDAGCATTVTGSFLIVGVDSAPVVVQLSGAEPVQIVSRNSKAVVDVSEVKIAGNQATAMVKCRVPLKSKASLTNQAVRQFDDIINQGMPKAREALDALPGNPRDRFFALRQFIVQQSGDRSLNDDQLPDAFLRIHAINNSRAGFRSKLEELAKRRPRWFTAAAREAWDKEPAIELFNHCRDFVQAEAIYDHLGQLGLSFDLASAEAVKKAGERIDAVYTLRSGEGADAKIAKKAVDSLGQTTTKLLIDALEVRLSVQVMQPADPNDPNSQWFNAQRLACRATGAATIRVNGRLDPKGNDTCDWWILEGFDPTRTALEIPANSMIAIERVPLVSVEGENIAAGREAEPTRLALRVVPKGEAACDYTLELNRLPKGDGETLIIHESPSRVATNFPY